MNYDLFETADHTHSWREEICPGARLLRQYALPHAEEFLQAVDSITRQSPFRQMQTPGGYTMSAALAACGDYGWISDRKGYRYSDRDPISGNHWPGMPEIFVRFAKKAAKEAGFAGFSPDACVINRYSPGSKMSLHQDKDERDLSAPIVSVSLGVPALFLFGGKQRSGKTIKIPLVHGDVVVWGGEARLNFHGIAPIKEARHPLTGADRINITFRKTGLLATKHAE